MPSAAALVDALLTVIVPISPRLLNALEPALVSVLVAAWKLDPLMASPVPAVAPRVTWTFPILAALNVDAPAIPLASTPEVTTVIAPMLPVPSELKSPENVAPVMPVPTEVTLIAPIPACAAKSEPALMPTAPALDTVTVPMVLVKMVSDPVVTLAKKSLLSIAFPPAVVAEIMPIEPAEPATNVAPTMPSAAALVDALLTVIVLIVPKLLNLPEPTAVSVLVTPMKIAPFIASLGPVRLVALAVMLPMVTPV